MPGRGISIKTESEKAIVIERRMITRYYRMTWDLKRCAGCDIGPSVCPKDAVKHVEGKVENGRLIRNPSVDIDPEKCVLCGICEVMCPKNAIALTINNERENPVLAHGVFPNLIRSTVFDRTVFDWSRKDLVIDNCPTNVINHDETEDTLVVDDEHCIRCRQCEIASNGAFRVVQTWEGTVTLKRERCVEGCLACADGCPTRALHVRKGNRNRPDELGLADYFCIMCGACTRVCPIKPEFEDFETTVESCGVTKSVTRRRLLNADRLPVRVDRKRIRHDPVDSAVWLETLAKLADDKAKTIEIDRKRALRRRDLLKALSGAGKFLR